MYIYPYNNNSESVSSLKVKIPGVKTIKLEGSRFIGNPDKLVVNWGNSFNNPEIAKCKVLNKPEKVAFATNKKNFFDLAKAIGINVPEYTVDRHVAYAWLRNEGTTVVVREKLTGHSGEGIVLLDNIPSFDDYDHSRAKIYVKYIPKKEEYRVHVFCGEVIDVQRKSTRDGEQPVDWRVRNHANGFIFTRGNANPPEGIVEQAKKSVIEAGLDFGAVDVIYNAHHKKAYVLEVNTAPGLEGTTLEVYARAISNFFR